MKRSFALIGVVVIVFAASGVLFGDDQEKKDTAKGSRAGAMPQNYSKLGLSDDQKKKIRDIRADYNAKIQKLEDQIKELKKGEKVALEDVLTDAQRARLRELVLEKAPGERDKK